MSVKNFDSFFNKVWPQLDVNNDGNIDNQDKLEMEKQNNKNLSLYLKLEDALDNVSISKLDFEKACDNSYNIDDCINNLKNKNIPNNTKQSFGLTDTNTNINTTENEDNENSSYDISFKTKQVIEKFFGNKYEIKPSLINKDSKFFEIHTEDSTGFLCVYQTGDFELNISEKENTIKSLFTYDKEGNLKNEPNIKIYNMSKILDNLVNKTSEKNFSSTNEFLDFLINNVNDMEGYQELLMITYNESKYEAIYNELNSEVNRKKIYEDLKTKINKMGEKYQDLSNLLNENMNLSQLLAIGEFASVRQNNLLNENISEWNADGQLFNKNIEQGGEGDCWFISFLYSASRHPEFIKAYSQNIEINNDEKTYTIKMRGKEYTYTFDQILYANEFSSGDMDVRVLEMAIRDFYAKELGSEMYNPMAQGGFMETAAYFFGIDEVQNILSVKNINNEFFDKYIELIKGKNCICTTSTTVENCEAIDMKSGKTITIDSYHELSLVDADDKYVYIVNPQDTKSELKLDIETFKANFEFYATDLSLLLEGINKYKK